MTRLPRLALTAVLAVVLATLPLTSASGATKKFSDERGDAKASVDIVALSVNATRKAYTMRLDIKNLRQAGTFTFSFGGAQYELDQVRVHWGAGKPVYKYFRCGESGYCKKWTCKNVKLWWNADKDFVAARVPGKCDDSEGYSKYVFEGSAERGDDYDHTWGGYVRFG